MGAPHLHARRRDAPHCAREIELTPGCQPQFAGTRKKQREQLERDPRSRLPLERIDRAKERAEATSVRDGGAGRWPHLRKGSLECVGRIHIGPGGRDRIPEHAADRRAKPTCGLIPLARLEALEHAKDRRRADRADGFLAELRVREGEQPLGLCQGRFGPRLPLQLGQVFAGDGAEGRRIGLGTCGALSLGGGIKAFREQALRLVPRLAGPGERHRWVDAEGKELLLALEAIGEVPESRAVRPHPKLQSSAVG
jgi:hypothetical protein